MFWLSAISMSGDKQYTNAWFLNVYALGRQIIISHATVMHSHTSVQSGHYVNANQSQYFYSTGLIHWIVHERMFSHGWQILMCKYSYSSPRRWTLYSYAYKTCFWQFTPSNKKFSVCSPLLTNFFEHLYRRDWPDQSFWVMYYVLAYHRKTDLGLASHARLFQDNTCKWKLWCMIIFPCLAGRKWAHTCCWSHRRNWTDCGSQAYRGQSLVLKLWWIVVKFWQSPCCYFSNQMPAELAQCACYICPCFCSQHLKKQLPV